MTNPYQYRISKERWAEFEEHYAWQLLKSPDYRLGQGFLNYFNEVDKIWNNDGDLGKQQSVRLYYETNNVKAMEIIKGWIEQ